MIRQSVLNLSKVTYVPDRGDIIWIQFNPQAGHEQALLRPALVLSPKKYNQKTSLCVVCPMTTQIKGYPFEVKIEGRDKPLVVLSDQVKSLDWRARQARLKERVSQDVLDDVLGKLAALLGYR
jgi:mRNA interferase MazF